MRKNTIGYVELEEAKEFLKKRYSDFDEKNLEKFLYQAFDKIEAIGTRKGKKTCNNFPRKNDTEAVMTLIKKVQMLEAYAIATGGNEDIKKLAKGITSKAIGDMSVSYSKQQKIGDVTFASIEAARIMKRFAQKTF